MGRKKNCDSTNVQLELLDRNYEIGVRYLKVEG